ncbi:MAG: hypothetical protein HFJ05_07350 [Eubacterium sp.]|nr:hypothetical protein [Eubacterium sp.]
MAERMPNMSNEDSTAFMQIELQTFHMTEKIPHKLQRIDSKTNIQTHSHILSIALY